QDAPVLLRLARLQASVGLY
ncbi:hypothetical protein, partial [Pseudomonas aeruginosa]